MSILKQRSLSSLPSWMEWDHLLPRKDNNNNNLYDIATHVDRILIFIIRG